MLYQGSDVESGGGGINLSKKLRNWCAWIWVICFCGIFCRAFGQIEIVEPIPERIYQLEPFYVTGSLLPKNEREPAETLDSLSYDDLLLDGAQRPIESLRLQPSFFGAMNTANDSNGGSGSSSPSIHALGVLRTLNLINGRRAGGSSAFGLEPGEFGNLNLIPQAAITNIDMLLETASTTYGSDAMAGVVNIQLLDDFDGVRLNGLYGNTTQGGGETQQYSLTSGYQIDENTHLTVLGSYYNQQVIWARDRDLSATTNFTSRGGTNRGSSTFPGRAILLSGGSVLNGILPAGTPFPTSAASYIAYDQNRDAYNYNEYAPDIPAMEIASGYASIEHDISERVTLYADGLYSEQKQANGLAPAPWTAYGNNSFFQAIQNSPHNPVAPDDLYTLYYRNFALGNLETNYRRNAYRVVGGARGIAGDQWYWDTAVLYTQSQMDADFTGIADARLLEPYINTGAFNPFAQVSSGVSQGIAFDNDTALKASSVDTHDEYYENMFLYDAKLAGDLFSMPAGAIKGAFGYEYRYESIDTTPDELWAGGANLGGSGYTQPFAGQRNVFALFGEFSIPLISPAQEILGVERLGLDFGVRYEDFSDRGNDPLTGLSAPNSYNNISWKSIVTWQPMDTLTLRAAYSTGFRAPTLYESYASEVYDYPILVDPTGATPPGTPIPTLMRGNPSLHPEVSRNISASAIWVPNELPGVTLRVDYYYVTVKDAIANGAQFTLDQNNPNDVIRSYPGGPVEMVYSRFFNASSLSTQGLDYRIEYEHAFSENTHVSLSLAINQVLSYDAEVPGVGEISFDGAYIDKRSNNLSPGAVPQWRGLASAFFYLDRLSVGLTFQYIGSYADDPNFTYNGLPRTVDDYTRTNLVVEYEIGRHRSDFLNNLMVTVGVDNLFDNSPPFAAGAFADGYDTSLYTIQNRFVYCALSKKF